MSLTKLAKLAIEKGLGERDVLVVVPSSYYEELLREYEALRVEYKRPLDPICGADLYPVVMNVFCERFDNFVVVPIGNVINEEKAIEGMWRT